MEDELGRKEVAGIRVYVTKPPKKPAGLTFILTAANIPCKNYNSIKNALISIDHVVVQYYISILIPPMKNNRTKAREVYEMSQELKGDYNLEKYNIVGHSIGGKIALLVAALHNDDKSLRAVVALDPVDQNPVEFTNPDTKKNLPLKNTGVDILMTFTDNGFFINKDHNARAISRFNPQHKLVLHRNAGHMAYCDEDAGISWKSMMRGGNSERNRIVKEETAAIIKDKMQACTAKKASNKMGKLAGNMKKTVTSNIDGLQDDVKKAGMGGKFAIAKTMFKM